MTKEEIITQIEDLARDAKGRIDPEDPEDVFRKDYEALTEAIRILKEARHGKWVRRVYVDPQGGEWTTWKCNLCGRVEVLKEPYCSCGAKMDLEE